MRTKEILTLVGATLGAMTFGTALLIGGLLGGLLIGVTLIGGVFFAPLFIGVAASLLAVARTRTTQISSEQSAGDIRIAELKPVIEEESGYEKTMPVSVTVRVTEAHGTCPLGFTFIAGEEYVFDNGTATPTLCPRATKALQPLIEQMRTGQYPARTFPFCQTRQHIVVFDLKKKEALAMASRAGN